MTLNEFIVMTGLDLHIRWTEGLGIFQVDFRGVDVKEGMMLAGNWGGGKTREAAIKDYCRQIQGQLLVLNAYNEKRREIKVPELLVYVPAEDKPPTEQPQVKNGVIELLLELHELFDITAGVIENRDKINELVRTVNVILSFIESAGYLIQMTLGKMEADNAAEPTES